jgi:hypothetical protein
MAYCKYGKQLVEDSKNRNIKLCPCLKVEFGSYVCERDVKKSRNCPYRRLNK